MNKQCLIKGKDRYAMTVSRQVKYNSTTLTSAAESAVKLKFEVNSDGEN